MPKPSYNEPIVRVAETITCTYSMRGNSHNLIFAFCLKILENGRCLVI
ncbi:MAG: hypothetical protein H6656_03300 [Ardenticatenaceae bacterium]|nr:hypothetical protein [Ardenticatenaceae bacterium]